MPKSEVDCSNAATTGMKSEIDSAVNFLTNILRNGSVGLTADQMLSFRRCLETTLVTRYRDHWFPDRPQRGSAYRCVRIVNRKLDRLLASAAVAAGVPEPLLERLLPTELTLWVDPDEVSSLLLKLFTATQNLPLNCASVIFSLSPEPEKYYRVVTNREYSGISLNMETSWNYLGFLCNIKEKIIT